MLRKIALVLFAAALASCASSANLPTLTLPAEAAVYRLGTGDEIKVTVYGEEKLTGNYPVNDQGNVAFPLLGEVSAVGKSLDEFEKAVSAGLSDGLVNKPRVTIQVVNFRPYYILGEVGKPGEYPFVDGLTIFSAVARAGGFTYRADQRRVYIRHKSGPDEIGYRLEGSTPVQPGDTIRITERAF